MSYSELMSWCEAHPHRGFALAALLFLLFGALMQSGTSERRGGPRRTAAFTLQILGWLGLSTVVSIGLVTTAGGPTCSRLFRASSWPATRATSDWYAGAG